MHKRNLSRRSQTRHHRRNKALYRRHKAAQAARTAVAGVTSARPPAPGPLPEGQPPPPAFVFVDQPSVGEAPARSPKAFAGGDKREDQRSNQEKLHRYLTGLKRDNRPLPVLPRRPRTVSMTEVAAEAGIDKYALLRKRSKLRKLVEDTVSELGMAVRLRRPVTEGVPLGTLLETAVSARRRQNREEGLPDEHGLKTLNQLFYALAKRDPAGMKIDAGVALANARRDRDAGRLALAEPVFGELEFAEKCLADCAKAGGLPEDFPGALSASCRHAGLTLSALARAAGVPTQTVINWAAGRKNPDRRSEVVVKKIESILGLETGVLVSRIRRVRAGRGRLAADFYPVRLRGPEHARRRGEISRLLGDDARIMEEATRHRLIDEIEAELDRDGKERRIRGALLVQPYALKLWPKGLRSQWNRLKQHKMKVVALPGVDNETLWTEGGARKWHSHVSYLAGFAVLPEAGDLRLRLDQIDLIALFRDPKLAHALIAFKNNRLVAAGGEETVTYTDADLLTFGKSLFTVSGFLRHLPACREALGFANKTDKAWDERCRAIVAAYAEIEAGLRRKAVRFERMKVKHRAVKPILDMDEPMTAVAMLADGLRAEYESYQEGSMEKAEALQDLVYVLLQAQAPFRPRTTILLEYRPNNAGHLKRDDNGWFIDAPKVIFKNRDAEVLKQGFHRRLEDKWGLNELLDIFVTKSRFALLDRLKSPYLFVYGRTFLAADLNGKRYEDGERANAREAALAQRVRAFTGRHLRWDERNGTGIKGIRCFSPTGFRHIGATSVVKRTGSFRLAADFIADSEEMAKRHYIAYLPSDRAALLASSTSESLDAAAVEAKVRRSSPKPVKHKVATGGHRATARNAAVVSSRPASPRRRRRVRRAA